MNRIETLCNKTRYTFEDLRTVVEILRSPEGCPWDKEQTHDSIRMNFLEEVYEAVETIDNKDLAGMREELGDVLFQVAFHSRIAEEDGWFDLEEVCDEICRKMIIRHPHVFGDTVAETSEKVLNNWEKIKAETKKQETLYDRLAAVPVTFPALMKAQKLIHRTEKYGVSVPTGSYDFSKSENREAAVAEELWQLLSAADKAGVDAESALRHLSERFIQNHKND